MGTNRLARHYWNAVRRPFLNLGISFDPKSISMAHLAENSPFVQERMLLNARWELNWDPLGDARMKPLETTTAALEVVDHTCPLSGLAVGCRGRVLSVSGDTDARRRLLEMGFCNGAVVEAIRRAPFGDPIEFRLRGYCLSLRSQQACCVTIAPAEE